MQGRYAAAVCYGAVCRLRDGDDGCALDALAVERIESAGDRVRRPAGWRHFHRRDDRRRCICGDVPALWLGNHLPVLCRQSVAADRADVAGQQNDVGCGSAIRLCPQQQASLRRLMQSAAAQAAGAADVDLLRDLPAIGA